MQFFSYRISCKYVPLQHVNFCPTEATISLSLQLFTLSARSAKIPQRIMWIKFQCFSFSFLSVNFELIILEKNGRPPSWMSFHSSQ